MLDMLRLNVGVLQNKSGQNISGEKTVGRHSMYSMKSVCADLFSLVSSSRMHQDGSKYGIKGGSDSILNNISLLTG